MPDSALQAPTNSLLQQILEVQNDTIIYNRNSMKQRFCTIGKFLLLMLLPAGQAVAQVPEWLWVEQSEGAAAATADEGQSVAVDPSGNSYVIGRFSGTVSYGTHALTSNGGYD